MPRPTQSLPDAAKPANGVGVIKTTVAVKGSTRRIPKTIVEAEDKAPTKVATLKQEKIRPETLADDDTDASNAGDAKPAKSTCRRQENFRGLGAPQKIARGRHFLRF